MRTDVNLNSDWKFTKLDESDAWKQIYDDGNWEQVHIPHTWNAVDGASGTDYYKGACWYRKEFSLESSWEGKRIFIEFQGSNSITDGYVNEQHIGQHRGGYSTFRFDITDHVRFGGTNILAVKVDNTIVDDVYPQKADFTFYGGIYRDVNLVIVHPVHVDLLDYGSQGAYIVQDQVTKDRTALTVKTRLANATEQEKKVRLWIDIFDYEGKTVTYAAREVTIPERETIVAEVPVVLDNPHLWHGRKDPYLIYAMQKCLSSVSMMCLMR